MTRRSPAATGAAQVVWALAAGDSKSPEDVAAAAERTCSELYTGLSRWIGTMGYRILFDRALALARAEHPVLTGLACLGGDQPVPVNIRPAPQVAEVGAGMVALVAILVDLLGRIVGEEMAVRLVEQAGSGTQPGPKDERERERERTGRAGANRESERDRARAEP